MKEYERSIIKYRPNLQYIPNILSNIMSKDANYKLSPTLDRLTKKTPSGVLGELLSCKEDAEVIVARVKKCIDSKELGMPVDDYLKAIKDKPDKALAIEKENASSINGTIQIEAIPLLLDVIEQYEALINITSKMMYPGGIDVNDLEKAEKEDQLYIDSVITQEINGTLRKRSKKEIESRVIQLDIVDKMRLNSKEFVKGIVSVLYSSLNKVYNDNIFEVVQTYGNAPVEVLEALYSAYKIEFKKTVLTCDNDKMRLKRLNNLPIKNGIAATFHAVSSLRDDKMCDVYEWVCTLDTDFDRSPITQIVDEVLSSVEFVNQEYERTKVEYYKQVKLDEIVKNDIVDSLLNKKTARQKANLINNILHEKRSNSFDTEKFIKANILSLDSVICTK